MKNSTCTCFWKPLSGWPGNDFFLCDTTRLDILFKQKNWKSFFWGFSSHLKMQTFELCVVFGGDTPFSKWSKSKRITFRFIIDLNIVIIIFFCSIITSSLLQLSVLFFTGLSAFAQLPFWIFFKSRVLKSVFFLLVLL